MADQSIEARQTLQSASVRNSMPEDDAPDVGSSGCAINSGQSEKSALHIKVSSNTFQQMQPDVKHL